MSYLGTIDGVGQITIAGTHVGNAEYEISVYQPRTLTEARGHIIAEREVVRACRRARKDLALVLETGESLPFVVTNDDGGGYAEIFVNIPDFD